MVPTATNTSVKWLAVVGCGALIAAIPPPETVTRQSWTLLAIFIATIVGSIVQPLRGSAMVLIGVIATEVFVAVGTIKVRRTAKYCYPPIDRISGMLSLAKIGLFHTRVLSQLF